MRSAYGDQAFILDSHVLDDPDSPAGQVALAAAHQQHARPECGCRPGGVEMYVARLVGGWYIIKRMPNSGSQHAPTCPSFELPASLTGRSAYAGTAIVEHQDAETELRLGFALHRLTEHDRSGRPASGSRPRRTPTNDSSLGLLGLLHYLWDEAGLSRWSPRMAGKRTWRIVRWHLTQAGERATTSATPLSQSLWVPEPFQADRKAALAQRRSDAWTAIGGERSRQDFMILIAELKTITQHDRGQVLRFRHMPDTPVMIAAAVWDAFAEDHQEDLRRWEANPEDHLMVAASFSLTKSGRPVIEQAAAMLTTSQWLPYSTARAQNMLAAAVGADRRFVTPLTYGRKRATFPTLVFTDTAEPVAAFADATAAAGDDNWAWAVGEPMPAFPAVAAIHRSDQHATYPQTGGLA
jgi:hypothetical protein